MQTITELLPTSTEIASPTLTSISATLHTTTHSPETQPQALTELPSKTQSTIQTQLTSMTSMHTH